MAGEEALRIVLALDLEQPGIVLAPERLLPAGFEVVGLVDVAARAGSGVADALEALAVAGRAWVLRFGPRPVWQIVSRLSAGGLLSRNTSSLATTWW